jgi:ubiquinone/menaquinone biosynthesis C-methylase UbiE
VVAVDYSLESLKVLKRKNLHNVMAVRADLTALPFKESVFDASVCTNTLQHFRPDGQQQQAAAELNRVTKDHGVVSVSVHHFSTGKRRHGWVKEGKPGQASIGYIFRFTRSELLGLFHGSVTKGIGFMFPRIPIPGVRIQSLLGTLVGRLAARLGHGHMLIAVATKAPSQ